MLHGRNVADVYELLALLTGSYNLRMSEGARRSRSPQMSSSIMPMPVQETKARTARDKEYKNAKNMTITGLHKKGGKK
jgi:hypothetical protein